ncbi:disease resistance protein L6-like isoform X2 [Quercus robur]|uniref:disease resistance protein L6-like isoform X2 n=1 Tax=Quercus robur TaxID=38942 RepID=UPI002163FCDD|nr:disease resistance protein L6-like isoform X2 [Quercus robur]
MEVLTETVKVIVEKIVGYTITAVGSQMGYLIRYKKNVDNLKNEVDDLEDDRKSVERKVEAARNNVEEIEDKVQRWQTRVQEINREVQEFLEEEGQAKLKCFNLKARYQIGRKAHKMGLAVKELKDKVDEFHTVGRRVPIGGGPNPIISTKGYEDFESRKSIFNGVMKALRDENIPAIGVCGMGGLGKTMLVGKIARQAEEDKLFKRIVTVVASQTPNLRQIQKDIAKQLQILDFSDEDAGHLLHERLKKEKILLIIDDIWSKLELEALGISFGDNKEGSKLLLTSRFQDVLGTDMDAQKIFNVGVLLPNEAVYLFSKIVGDLAENLNLKSTMIEVVKECDGLPIAITTVANALKKKEDLKVWKDALQQLRSASPTEIKEMHDKVYKSIELSYTFLTEEAKYLFLFCSLFEEDMVIPIALLWRILAGLDFFQNVYTMEQVRNRVHTLIERLKDSCLLLEGNGSGTFKMHDVIRDVAIYIANKDKDKEMLTIRSSDDLEKWSNKKKLKDFFGIALFDVKFSDLPKKLECPQLKFILLGDKDYSSAIPNHFFEGTKELKVFFLFDAYHSLPSSLSCLHNLQSLVLHKCDQLEDVAIIGELKNLKALTISGSDIKRLPIEIGQLTYLKLLDLKGCTKLEVIPPNVLSNLKRLEELYMKSSFNQWQVDGEITEINNTRVTELNHLSLLTTLCIHIPNAKILPKALLFEKLERYEILIGDDWDWDWDSDSDSDSDDEFEISRMVKLELDRSFQVEDGIKILLKRCEYLDLIPGEGIKNILYEVDKEGFPQLKHLYVRDSTDIQYIINLMGFQCVVFPLLECLSLDSMTNLEKICHGHDQLAMGSFRSLKRLEVSNCDELKFVFSLTMLGCFSQLQEMVIKNCKVMSAIVAKERKHEIQVHNITDDVKTNIVDFSQLRSLDLRNLPDLMGFYSDVDSQLLFSEKVAFFNLERIFIIGIDNLKMLWHNHQLIPDSFCKIKKLHVGSCKSLMNIFPSTMLRKFQNLEELKIEDCNLVEEVFEVRGENVDEICDKGSTQLRVLRHLTLINLPKLKHVWTSDPEAILTFQNLRQVKVSKCKTLKSLFPVSVARSLEQLESLHINDCELMEEIVALEEGLETMTKFVFPKITSLTLQSLPELKCFYPRKHTSEWPSVKSLTISKCDKVKIVASNELNFTETDELGDHVPVQQPLFLIEKVAFFNLETIIIDGMDNLKMLWQNQLVSNSICKIKKLHVGSCKNLMNIFPPNMLRRLQNLEELKIEDCTTVEEVFEVRGENVDEICDKGSTQLRHLTLINLPKLKHVWTSDPETILTFQNLLQVKVSKCKTLKSLFPVSVARSLEQLESLHINDCELMEEIIALEEGLETMIKFVFPQITSLTLQSLPELKCFYPRKHTSEWPSVTSLTISKCDKVKIVASNELNFTETDELGDHVPVQQPLFLIEKDTFPNLKELDLDLNETMNQTNGRLFGEFICKLEDLSLSGKDDKLIAVPSVFVEGLHYLKTLSVTNLFFDNEGQYAGTFDRLTELNLYKMPKLMLLWKENSEQGRAFQNLGILRVSECGRLKNLVPSSMHFRNLNTLIVWKCHGLISFATSSTVKSLVQLKQLYIFECKRMREIVTNEGEGEAGDEICFNQLEELYLDDLPSLRSFHLGNRTIKFPSLEYVFVIGCPEMKIFSDGVLSMPKLKQVGLGEKLLVLQRKLLPEEDVNSAIKRFWEEYYHPYYDPCVQQLFTEKTDASTSEAGEKNGVDNLEDDLKED